MNSIETFAPTSLPTLDSDEGKPVLSCPPDAAALETLRALMGGFPTSQVTASTALPQQIDSKNLLSLVERLLAQSDLPEGLNPLLNSLRNILAVGGDVKSNPALVQELKSLLREVVASDAIPKTNAPAQPWAKAADAPVSATTNSTNSVIAPNDAPITTSIPVSNALLPDSTTPQESLPNILNSAPATPSATSFVTAKPAPGLFAPNADLLSVQSDRSAIIAPSSVAVATDTALLSRAILESLNQSATDDLAPTRTAQPEDMPSLGNAILQSLGSQSSTPAVTSSQSTSSTTTVVDRIAEVSQMITQMADRVLVTDPLHGQVPEVRIKLADNVMDGTEVRVWREDGGQLRVEFETVSGHWARLLNEASPLLSQRLGERMPAGMGIQVTVQDHGQQPEDGRSRNRQTPWEVAQQANES
jgi:type III secretion system needle length determinant